VGVWATLRIGIANARTVRGVRAWTTARILARRPAAGTGGIPFHRVGENFEFMLHLNEAAQY